MSWIKKLFSKRAPSKNLSPICDSPYGQQHEAHQPYSHTGYSLTVWSIDNGWVIKATPFDYNANSNSPPITRLVHEDGDLTATIVSVLTGMRLTK